MQNLGAANSLSNNRLIYRAQLASLKFPRQPTYTHTHSHYHHHNHNHNHNHNMHAIPDLAEKESVSAAARAEFINADPWCHIVLDKPALVPISTNWTVPWPDAPSTFLRCTLHSFDAILAKQSYYRPAEDCESADLITNDSVDLHRPGGELWTLYSVGSGADSHTGVSHGGFITTLLDQQMGSLVRLSSRFGTPHTVNLNVDFKGLLRTPSVVLCRAWFLRAEGRKLKLKAVLQRDTDVPLIATAEALFISPKKSKM